MPNIKSNVNLQNSCNEKDNLPVMSMEAYEQLVVRSELYSLIQEGLDDIKSGNTRPFSDAMADIRNLRKQP